MKDIEMVGHSEESIRWKKTLEHAERAVAITKQMIGYISESSDEEYPDYPGPSSPQVKKHKNK